MILTQLVAGCGQTGALYLPQATDVAVTDGRPEGDADTAVTDTPTDVDATPSSSDPESVLPPP